MLATILQEEYLVLTFVYSIPKKILKEKENGTGLFCFCQICKKSTKFREKYLKVICYKKYNSFQLIVLFVCKIIFYVYSMIK